MGKREIQKSSTGIYHVLIESINNADVFTKEEDYRQFLDKISLTSFKIEFVVYAFCLTPKHVHLLLKIPMDYSIDIVISSILVPYVLYKNCINVLPLPTFQSPFKRVAVETDDCFLRTIWNIHRYPVEQNIVTEALDYPWSSYPLYLNTIQTGKEQTKHSYLDTSFVLGMFTSSGEFLEYMNEKLDFLVG
jgi:putative transposase